MKVFLVMAMLFQGHMSLSETGPYDTVAECKADFYRLIDKYVADGRKLSDLNGGCYYKPTEDAR